MNPSSTLMPILFCCALGGCAQTLMETKTLENTNNAQGEVDRQILESSRKIERMQLQLVQAGALNPAPKAVPVGVLSSDQNITLAWKGDAYQLLSKLAAEHGLTFVTTGVRLPLPVAIHVHDQPFEAVLDAIRAQTGYRASVMQSANKLTLQFNRLLEGKS